MGIYNQGLVKDCKRNKSVEHLITQTLLLDVCFALNNQDPAILLQKLKTRMLEVSFCFFGWVILAKLCGARARSRFAKNHRLLLEL